jgi:hypothetical protein
MMRGRGIAAVFSQVLYFIPGAKVGPVLVIDTVFGRVFYPDPDPHGSALI